MNIVIGCILLSQFSLVVAVWFLIKRLIRLEKIVGETILTSSRAIDIFSNFLIETKKENDLRKQAYEAWHQEYCLEASTGY